MLPVIDPITPIELTPKGANWPLLFQGMNISTKQQELFIVKFRQGTYWDKTKNMKELLAIALANKLGLMTIEPVIVDVTEKFVDQPIFPGAARGFAQKSIGKNLGSKFLSGAKDANHQFLDDLFYSVEIAAKIFVFDALIMNDDRALRKENLLITPSNQVVLIDHEKAFKYIDDKYQKIRLSECSWITNHYFFNFLQLNKEAVYKWINEFVLLFERIDDAFWIEAKNSIYFEWYDEDIFNRIKHPIELIAGDSSEFLNELKIIFAL